MTTLKTFATNTGVVYKMEFANQTDADNYVPPADRTLISNAPSDDHKWINGAWTYVAPKTPAELDQDALNAALISEGSVVRALGLVMFDEINKLRVKNGDQAYTLMQFKNALVAKMR